MYKLLLCTRYLRTRYIALASVISVMLGVATMIVVNSVMAGFSNEMRDRIKGVLSDIVIETNGLNGEKNPEAMKALIQRTCPDQIVGMAATVEIYGMVTFEYAGQWITRPISLIGIDPASKAEVGPLVDYLQSYRPNKDVPGLPEPPERKADEPAGWNLTPKAQAYRTEWAQRAAWFQEQSNADRAHRRGGSETPEAQQPVAAATTPADGEADASAQATAVPPQPVNPFENEEATLDEPTGPSNLGAPLPGRLYVGAGLVSFPDEDPETGKIVTHWMAKPGDDVKISTVTATTPPQPVYFNATIVDTFKSGMSEYDSTLVFCNLDYLQQARGMIDPATQERSVTSIQIKLRDFREAAQVVKRLEAVFPPGLFQVKTWEKKQGPLLAAVDIESSILNVLLFLIITVAGFGILAIFFMIVVEKTRDIGILKALGASSSGVMSIFLSYGLSLGMVGAGGGVLVGLLFVKNINTIEGALTWLTGRKVFDERIYYFPSIPTRVDPFMVCWVAAGAMAIAVLASILPARRAARLEPVRALRAD